MIHLEEVSFIYQGESEQRGVRNINLNIKDGECVLICGRSGCGKTTLTRLINGLIPAFYSGKFSGKIILDGKEVEQTPMYRLSESIGSVFQNPRSQFFNVDTDSEMAFGMENLSWSMERMQEGFSKTVSDLNMEHLVGRKVFEISGGEKQKVAFASIYAMNPNVYLLDEPSSNLDRKAIDELKQIIAFLKRIGKTIVIAEHRIYYLKELADRIIYMENGEIRQSYTAHELELIPINHRYSMGLRSMDLSEVEIPAYVRMHDNPILEVQNLSVTYHHKPVISQVNFVASPGEIIGIIGENGAGKSTLSRTLCGLHKEKGGSVRWKGKPVSAKERLKHSYMVMQEVGYQLFSDTVEKECCFGIKKPDVKSAEYAMKLLGIWDFRDLHPNTLSGGQKQRLAVAVSMVCKREILIFDEPTSGLDYDSMFHVAQLLRNLSTMGKIIFVVTHDYEFLTSVCSRILHLHDGRLLDDYEVSEENRKRLYEFFSIS